MGLYGNWNWSCFASTLLTELPSLHSRIMSKSGKEFDSEYANGYKYFLQSESKSWIEGIRNVVESLTVYKFEELQIAPGSFAKANRINGYVFCSNSNEDCVAVKMMKGNVLVEINMLKKISH